MFTDPFPELIHLHSEYFGWQWQADYGDAASALAQFVKDNPLSTAGAAVHEIDRLLGADLSGEELAALIQKEFGSRYSPGDDGIAAADWLKWVRRVLEENIRAARGRRVFAPGPGMRVLEFADEP